MKSLSCIRREHFLSLANSSQTSRCWNPPVAPPRLHLGTIKLRAVDHGEVIPLRNVNARVVGEQTFEATVDVGGNGRLAALVDRDFTTVWSVAWRMLDSTKAV